jgi:membrane-associated PAP2 superfamily phosphatase
MNRTGLLIALAIAVVTGVVFGLWPDLDLAVSRLFYRAGKGFPLDSHDLLNLIRDGSMYFVGLFVVPAIIALVVKLVRPRRPLMMRGRAMVFLITTIVLAPILTANVLLKDNWSRPRPRDVAAFGGTSAFLPWWDPRGPCELNCSFVGGEAAGAFWTLAPASLAPAPWRPLAYAAALTFGVAISAMRLAFGAHFFSDVVFAGVITFLIIWVMHALLYRRPQSRLTDAAIDAVLTRLGTALGGLFGGHRRSSAEAAPQRAKPGQPPRRP